MASTMQLTVAAFVQSLYDMVTSKADGLIDWTADGRSFVIRVGRLRTMSSPSYSANLSTSSIYSRLPAGHQGAGR